VKPSESSGSSGESSTLHRSCPREVDVLEPKRGAAVLVAAGQQQPLVAAHGPARVGGSSRQLPSRALAQLELLQLAGGGAGELVAELDRGRALVVGEALAAVGDELGLGSCVSRASTTRALTVSPHFSSGTPMTATSATSGWEKRASSTSIDETFSPPLMMTSFLRSEIAQVALVVEVPPSPVWNHPSARAAVGGLGLAPVAGEHHVAAGQHLAVLVDAGSTPEGGGAGAASFARRAPAGEVVPLGAGRLMVSSGEVSVRP
jgi:hypothetical protein